MVPTGARIPSRLAADHEQVLVAVFGGRTFGDALDQIGCGRSDRPHDPSWWTIDTFVDELSTPSAARLASWASAVPFLRRPAYDVASMQWTTRYEIRRPLKELPLSSYRCYAGMNRQVYETMAGPSEFFGTGTLMDWDVSDRLGQIDIPALITSGAHDEVTPRQAQILHAGIPGSRRVLFEHSAHCAVVEEPDRYRAVVEEFLAAADDRSGHQLDSAVWHRRLGEPRS
jgi:hypothetical protein